jgi:hypothetical protein
MKKRISYLNNIRESLYLKGKELNTNQLELSTVLSIINPNSNGDIPDYYYDNFEALMIELNSNNYSFEKASNYFNLLINREVGQNKKYWDCAYVLKNNTINGKEFFNDLKMYSIVYPLEGVYVRELESKIATR